MAVADIINSGGSQYTLGGNDYQPNQYDVKGDRVGQTPLDNGQPISNDYSNDTRTSQDWKQDKAQAVYDTQAAKPRDEDNYIYDDTGYAYEKVHNSRLDQMETAFVNYMVAASNPNVSAAQAVMAAGKAAFAQQAVVRRQGQIQAMRDKGYNSQDIDKWTQTGNPEDLIATKGKWQVAGNGILYNPLTSETKDVGLSQSQLLQNQQWQQGFNLDQQKVKYDTSKPIAQLAPGTTAIMPDNSVVQTQPNTGGAGGVVGDGSRLNTQYGWGMVSEDPTHPGQQIFIPYTQGRNAQPFKSGSNIGYQTINADGSLGALSYGPLTAQGASGKASSINETSEQALTGLVDLAKLSYGSGGTWLSNKSNQFGNFFTGNADEFASVEKQSRTNSASGYIDQALAAAAPRALLKVDADAQAARGSVISTMKKPEENQRILNSRISSIAYGQVVAAYVDSHGGHYPSPELATQMRDQRIKEIYIQHPELVNAFGQKEGEKGYTVPPVADNTPPTTTQQQQPPITTQTQRQPVQPGSYRTRAGVGYRIE